MELTKRKLGIKQYQQLQVRSIGKSFSLIHKTILTICLNMNLDHEGSIMLDFTVEEAKRIIEVWTKHINESKL